MFVLSFTENKNKMLKIILFVLLIKSFIAEASTENSITCSPALEGSRQYINVTWDSQKSFTIRKHGGIIIAVCKKKVCTFMAPQLNYSHVSNVGSTSSLTITIYNVSINARTKTADTWELHFDKHPRPLDAVCTVVAFGQKINCENYITRDGIRFICFAYRVYPALACKFSVIHNGESLYRQIPTAHIQSSSSDVYYNASCSATVPWSDVTLPYVDIDVMMYPNATGSSADAQFGARTKLTFDFDISAECPPVQEGSTSLLTVIWNNMTSLRVDRDDGTTVLSCTAHKACGDRLPAGYSRTVVTGDDGRTRLTLRAHNVTRHGSKSATINWNVSVPDTPQHITVQCKIFERSATPYCNYNILTSGVDLKCYAQNIFPQGKCLIKSTQETEKEVSPEAIDYTHNVIPMSSFSYNTECAALVPWDMVNQKQPEVSVIIYPDVTDSDSDSEYGTDMLVKIQTEGPPVVLDECPNNVERGQNVTCACRSNDSSAIVYWNSNSSESTDGTNVLTFEARMFQVFQCQGISSKGALGVANVYKPHVKYPPVVGALRRQPGNGSSDDAVVDNTGLHIQCEEGNSTLVNVELRKSHVPVIWSLQDNAGLWEGNKQNCMESQYYECVEMGEDMTAKDNSQTSVQCSEMSTGGDSSDGAIVAVVCVIIVICLVIAAVLLVLKVKPSFVRFLRRSSSEDCYSVNGRDDTYQPAEGITYTPPRNHTLTLSGASTYISTVGDDTYQLSEKTEGSEPKKTGDYDYLRSKPIVPERQYPPPVISDNSQKDNSGYITPVN